MKHSTFFWFVLPSAFLMLLFIALPVASVVTQSMYTAHEQVLVTVENAGRLAASPSPQLTKKPPKP